MCLFQLKDVENEVMSHVVSAIRWVVVVPTLVVDRDPHLGRVAVVQAVRADLFQVVTGRMPRGIFNIDHIDSRDRSLNERQVIINDGMLRFRDET